MPHRTPCSRHSRSVWIASCDDCTAWHLADLRSRRDAPAPVDTDRAAEPRAHPGEADAA
ncbi:hypothetical protein ACI79D_02195 [Geodermatophilus sp. SYSU D00708]